MNLSATYLVETSGDALGTGPSLMAPVLLPETTQPINRQREHKHRAALITRVRYSLREQHLHRHRRIFDGFGLVAEPGRRLVFALDVDQVTGTLL